MKRTFLLFLAFWVVIPAFGQERRPEHQQIARHIDELIAQGQAGNNRAVLEGAMALKKRTEDSRNVVLLEQLYTLISISAQNLRLPNEQILGSFHATLLRFRAYGPSHERSVSAVAGLALSFDQAGHDRPMQIAAAQALGGFLMLNRNGALEPRLAALEAAMRNLLAQSAVRAARPALALAHFNALLAMSEGALSPEQKQAIEQKSTALKAQIAASRPVERLDSCRGSQKPDAMMAQSCLRLADQAHLAGDNAHAERILSAMLDDASANTMPDARLPAALALYILRASTMPPDAEALSTIADQLAHKLAPTEHPSSALIAYHLLSERIATKRHDARLLTLAGHAARRAAREGNEGIALRLLDAQALMQIEALARMPAGERALALRLDAVLLLFDAASYAELNGYDGLARTYLDAALNAANPFETMAFADLELRLKPYSDPARGFVFPSPAAAAEFLGRTALQSASNDPSRAGAILRWLNAESSLRDNNKRASALLRTLIPQVAKVPGLERLHAELLTFSMRFVEDPAMRIDLGRRALELLKPMPETENLRVGLLLDLSAYHQQIGEHDQADALLQQAIAMGTAFHALDLKHQSTLLMRQAEAALREGDLASGIAKAEDALVLVVQKTPDGSALRLPPARFLATLLAHNGRMDRARIVYHNFVFPALANPLEVGEGQALRERLGWVALEAQFNVKPETLNEIISLQRMADLTSSRDDTIQYELARAQSMAQYGLGAPLLALEAGRKAMALGHTFANDRTNEKQDRALLETLVGSGVLAANR